MATTLNEDGQRSTASSYNRNDKLIKLWPITWATAEDSDFDTSRINMRIKQKILVTTKPFSHYSENVLITSVIKFT